MLRTTLDWLKNRRAAYQRTFLNPIGQEVLEDLARFCRANETCFQADPRRHAALEGRREVWLRIVHHCHLTTEQQAMLYSARQPIAIASQGDTDG